MSSLKRASKMGQKTHRERSQPEARAHLGHLEKKKDYVQRAQDYNRKKEKLQKLRRSALDRNPDEFHYHMVRSRVGDDGVHRDKTPEPDEDTAVQKKLGNIKDLKYVKHRLNIENKKIEKLRATLHLADASVFKSKHTIFVDTEEDAKKFDPVRYFDTPEELIDRSFNRPHTSTLQTESVVNALSKSDVVARDRERRVQYNELLKRMERAKELRVVVDKLEVRKNLADTKACGGIKPEKIQKGEAMKAPVFKWTYERKK